MMPRLQAEEDLRLVDALAVGTGAAAKDARRAYLRELEGRARAREERAAPASEGALAAMGIRVVKVPRG